MRVEFTINYLIKSHGLYASIGGAIKNHKGGQVVTNEFTRKWQILLAKECSKQFNSKISPDDILIINVLY